MPIALILDASRLWRWHHALIDALEARPGTRVTVSFSSVQRPVDPAVTLALMLEATISKGKAPSAFEPLKPYDFDRWFAESAAGADIVIDLAALELEEHPQTRTLVPLYDGVPGGSAFWSAVLNGEAPALSVLDSSAGVLSIGQPALEAPHALSTSAASVVTRLIEGLLAVTSGRASGAATPFLPDFGARAPGLSFPAVKLLSRKVASRARRVLDQKLATGSQWATAWRTRAPGFDPIKTRQLARSDFKILPDDGARYYADPFVFARGEDTDVFVEELPYTSGRGIISMFTLRADGTLTAPKPVLETAFHLSYPLVFSHGGAVWMLPEQSASGGLILYRAAHYPNQWEPVARIIDEPLHDATLFEYGDRLWITANTQGPAGARWGSSWDTLSIYSAQTLLGPWEPHPANPVLIDAGSARPAGQVFQHEGTLYRPVQDCRGGYGQGLGIAAIQRLDADGFSQQLVARMAFHAASGVAGPHTLNRLSRQDRVLELIDLFAPASHLKA